MSDKPLSFAERAEPVTAAVDSGEFDPVGKGYTRFVRVNDEPPKKKKPEPVRAATRLKDIAP